jgi:hypothetical protein
MLPTGICVGVYINEAAGWKAGLFSNLSKTHVCHFCGGVGPLCTSGAHERCCSSSKVKPFRLVNPPWPAMPTSWLPHTCTYMAEGGGGGVNRRFQVGK